MQPVEYLARLRQEADALLDTAGTDLHAPVPSCPEWVVADLLVHVGLTWARATDVLATDEEAARRPVPEVGPDAALLDWGRARADEVAEAVANRAVAEPNHACWTLGPPRTRAFWARRMVLETVLHWWDARGAVGRPAPMDADLAADGVDEFLTVMLPRCLQRRPGRWTGESVHLHRTDGDGEWWLRLDAGEATVEAGHKKGDVAVRGSASDLYLWCTGRGTVDTLPDLDVVGDRSVAERWSSDIAF